MPDGSVGATDIEGPAMGPDVGSSVSVLRRSCSGNAAPTTGDDGPISGLKAEDMTKVDALGWPGCEDKGFGFGIFFGTSCSPYVRDEVNPGSFGNSVPSVAVKAACGVALDVPVASLGCSREGLFWNCGRLLPRERAVVNTAIWWMSAIASPVESYRLTWRHGTRSRLRRQSGNRPKLKGFLRGSILWRHLLCSI